MRNDLSVFLALVIGLSQGATSAAAQDTTSEFDRIYGVQKRARMQAAPKQDEMKLKPEDEPRILEFNKQRLKLPSNEATLSTVFAANPVLSSLGNESPDLYYVLYWNDVALDTVSLDHTNSKLTKLGDKFYGEQFGPPRASRVLAMVQLAVFEAANTLTREFQSYKPTSGPSLQAQILTEVNSPNGGKTSKHDITVTRTALTAAVSFAAYGALVKLYPKKKPLLAAALEKSLVTVSPQDELSVELGRLVGEAAADVVMKLRANDNSNTPDASAKCTEPRNSLCLEPRFPSLARLNPLKFQPDDISRTLTRLGGNWGKVTLFEPSNSKLVHKKPRSRDFTIDLGSGVMLEPPAKGSLEFEAALAGDAFGETPNPHQVGAPKVPSSYGVWSYGGSGVAQDQTPGMRLNPENAKEGPAFATPTKRSGGANDPKTQEFQANFWGYDGTALLCAPPRLYNMIAVTYPFEPGNSRAADVNDVTKMARYLALVNLALADAGVVSWQAKYDFDRARPVDYIRFGEPGRKVMVGTAESQGADWTPLGQVASNFSGQNYTPAFPSYPSGHAVFGGALFEIIRSFFHIEDQTKDTPFHFVSDEYNGKNVGNDGRLRPFTEVLFTSLSAAEWENGESRVWLGIHFQFDADHGIKLGNKIARNVFDHQFAPVSP